MTEDSRKHLRGYGSFPEGAEPTDQIAAHDAGDPVSGAPAPIAPTRPGIADQRPAPTAAHPWDSPPSTARFRPGYAGDSLDAESTGAVVPGSEVGGFGGDLADPFFEPESEAAGPRVVPHATQGSVEPSWMVASRPGVAPAASAGPSPVRPDGGVSGSYFAPRPASSPDTPGDASRQPDRPSTAAAPPAGVSPVEGGSDPWAPSSGPYAASSGESDPPTGRWASGGYPEPSAGEDPTGRSAAAGGHLSADRQDATRPGIGWADGGGEDRDWRARGGSSDSDRAPRGQTAAGPAAGFPQDTDPWDPYATQPTSADPAGADSTNASATGTGFASWSLASAGPAGTTSVAIDPAARASAATAPADVGYPSTGDADFAGAPFPATTPASAPPMANGPIYEPPDRAAAPAARNTGDPNGGGPYGYPPLPGGWNPPADRNRPAGDPYGLPAASAPRIEPSRPPRRTRLLTGTLIGLVVGLLLFGTAGWFAGRATAPAASPQPQSTRASANNGLGVFEQSQAALNKSDFNGTKLVSIAQGWLPYLSTCGRSGNPGGPRLANGEKTRVRCTLDGMSALFVEYNSTADRDRALARTREQSADARKLTPGVARPTERAAPSGRTSGSYVEFAYELTEGGVTRTVAGVWWDDAQTPIAAYLLAYWKDGLGERWEPVRDLWSRYA